MSNNPSKPWGLALGAGTLLWSLVALATSAHPPGSQQALAWRWLRTVNAHPIRSSLAFACLVLAFTGGSSSLLPERPERDRERLPAGLE